MRKIYLGCLFIVSFSFAQTIELKSAIPNISSTGGNNSVHVGVDSGNNSTGVSNSFFGFNSGLSNTTGNQNSFFGFNSGYSNTTGIHNVFIGSKTGEANSSGSENVFVGRGAGFKNTIGNSNIFIGQNSAYNNTSGNLNVFIGKLVGVSNVSGNENLFVGNFAGQNNNDSVGKNTFLGTYSGYNNIGEGNVFIGYESGYNISGSNKLSISNSNSTTPLIYGEFDNNKLVFNANVGIGTSAFVDGSDTYRLSVKGKMRAEEVKVYTTWADYVFHEKYKLPSLEEVEKHIKEKGHLINVPSGKEIEEKGLFVGEMTKIQQEKIEELTLYLIQQKKEIEELKEQVRFLLEKS